VTGLVHQRGAASWARLGLVLALALAGCADRKGISQANYDKIHPYMTQQEVEAILGAPGLGLDGSYRFQNQTFKPFEDKTRPQIQEGEIVWELGSKSIRVTFQDGKVIRKTQTGLQP
jgi:hypothetical protein